MKSIVRVLVLAFVLQFSTVSVKADEGMWLPFLLGQLNEAEMKSMGMNITAKDIYDINKGSLKDAIVSFGGFCTGEVVSNNGLVFTNHHCGFSQIQKHSSITNNYLRDGFWAKNHAEELANPGLYVQFIVSIHDVTNQALVGVVEGMSEAERQKLIAKNIDGALKAQKIESYQESYVRPFFEGNKYFLFVTEKYNDVRLVGAPPSSIGNFGHDSDNWMWPRHTGDFSVFRIYANRENKPAAYSPDNVPYKPKKALSISISGVNENDFTMVFGFPGKTMQYLPGAAVNQIMTVSDPLKISIRDKALEVLGKYMREDEQIKIQYASKYQSISNAWKKWQGEVLGLTRTNAMAKKNNYEEEFQKRVNANSRWKENYGSLLSDFEKLYTEHTPLSVANDYYTEVISRIELFTISAQLNALVNAYEKNGETGYKTQLERTKNSLTTLYKDFNSTVDKKLFESLLPLYANKQEAQYVSPILKQWLAEYNGDFAAFTKAVYEATDFEEKEKTLAWLNESAEKVVTDIKSNKVIALYNDILKLHQQTVQPAFRAKQQEIDALQRTYMKAQMEVMKERKFYPDANSTLRVTYGKVKGYEPKDGVYYNYYTYLDGVLEKYKPGDYEYDVPSKLIDLYKTKDYGAYGKDGKMPVCFIAMNHTTGGNSGSPALDANGNLIGINFDRVWEGTMSDINYDPSICRNIMVDIRYVLFIIDKYAGATHLIEEMNLVKNEPKKKKKK